MERGAGRRAEKRSPYDVFWAAPESAAVWDQLPVPVLEAIVRSDEKRLAVERSRVSPELREKITTPVYSVADRFASWERLVRRMEPGWPGGDFYPVSAYGNDLDSRDVLDEVMRALPEEAQAGVLGRLLERLDARFRAASVPDASRSLRPWVRPTKEVPDVELAEWWRRRPAREPWV
ncbi:hypothetical protein [Streptomyces sp. MMBL 11-3]|uniref:hypothetical protein n=1 Tax=Streptomyces sp. MMBL 11-3 TaxID=3382639 RepID=UPI0039B38F2F